MMTMKRTYEDAMDILNEMYMRNPTQRIEEIRSELVAIAKEFSKPCYEVVSDAKLYDPNVRKFWTNIYHTEYR